MPALRFDNALRARTARRSREQGPRVRQVQAALFSRVAPTPVAAPRLVAHSREVAALLGLRRGRHPLARASPRCSAATRCSRACSRTRPTTAATSSATGPGSSATAARSRWAKPINAGRRALGAAAQGRRARRRTRARADGRAVLRSSIREFLCSEAMHHLGVPTTRALCLVATGEQVVRDMFYDGHPQAEPGAIVCRVAPSFIRFGNFELPHSRGDVDAAASSWSTSRIAPRLPGARRRRAKRCTRDWFARGRASAPRCMIAHWMRVGFVHGVMNTDNMSILGLTIDYGPYGWIDDFDPDWTPNTTDAQGRRYRFGQQPQIAYWNLTRLAQRAVAAVRRRRAAAGRAAALRRRLHRGRSRQHRAQARAGASAATRTSS